MLLQLAITSPYVILFTVRTFVFDNKVIKISYVLPCYNLIGYKLLYPYY